MYIYIYAHNWLYEDASMPFKPVTLLRRRASVNAPAASYWLRRVVGDDGTECRRVHRERGCRGGACNSPFTVGFFRCVCMQQIRPVYKIRQIFNFHWAFLEHREGPIGPHYPTTHPSLRVFIVTLALIRYDTRCYFNVQSRADTSQLSLPHGTGN